MPQSQLELFLNQYIPYNDRKTCFYCDIHWIATILGCVSGHLSCHIFNLNIRGDTSSLKNRLKWYIRFISKSVTVWRKRYNIVFFEVQFLLDIATYIVVTLIITISAIAFYRTMFPFPWEILSNCKNVSVVVYCFIRLSLSEGLNNDTWWEYVFLIALIASIQSFIAYDYSNPISRAFLVGNFL